MNSDEVYPAPSFLLLGLWFFQEFGVWILPFLIIFSRILPVLLVGRFLYCVRIIRWQEIIKGCYLLGFIGPAIPFLPRFSLLPQLIQQAMKVDTNAVIDLSGKNVKVKKVFWTLFVMMAGLMQARVVDPVTYQQSDGIIGV